MEARGDMYQKKTQDDWPITLVDKIMHLSGASIRKEPHCDVRYEDPIVEEEKVDSRWSIDSPSHSL